MLPRHLPVPAGLLSLALVLAAVHLAAQSGDSGSATPASSAPLKLDGGSVALEGPWQFHTGDNSAWSSPGFDDSSWEQLSASKPWGAQTHPNTEGFGWYRMHVAFAPGTPGTLALLIPMVDDAYEVYWNGRLIGTLGKVPPHINVFQRLRPISFNLGTPEPGVLAVRVWKEGFGSYDSGLQGGFEAPPLVGSQQSISVALGAWNYNWLLGQQLNFALNSLYALVALICFIVWFRDRRQWLVLWMAGFAFSHALTPEFTANTFPLSSCMGAAASTPFFCLGDISLWFLLAWLLDLRSDARLMRVVRWVAIIDMAAAIPDVFTGIGFSLPNPVPWQWLDALFTLPVTVFEIFPFYIIAVALVRQARLDWARWAVALVALLTQVLFVCSYDLEQGSRFTHWTLGNRIAAPLFTIFGSPVTVNVISGTLLLIVLAFAVYRYAAENTRHQLAMEQELQSARAVQQVLVPAEFPEVPGFTINSVYQPASEVGGDFFQILPAPSGGVLIVIGDVSGKGMPAAMTVSLLVGAVRTAAAFTTDPARILGLLNERMCGRGLATCLALRIDQDGCAILINAGHLPPYLNGRELAVEGALPLGAVPGMQFPVSRFTLAPGDSLLLMTDGVVEAQDVHGQLFGFDRIANLLHSGANGATLASAAQAHGQEDDITVLTLTFAGAPAHA